MKTLITILGVLLLAAGCASARYQVDDDVAVDTLLGLMWARSPGSGTFAEAKQSCADLELGGHADWRLPHTGNPRLGTDETYLFGNDSDDIADCLKQETACSQARNVSEDVFPKLDINVCSWTSDVCVDEGSNPDYSSCTNEAGYTLPKSSGQARYVFCVIPRDKAAAVESDTRTVLCVRPHDPDLPFGAY